MLAQAVSKYSLELSKGENQLLAGHMNKAFLVWAVAEFNSGDVNCSESLPCIYCSTEVTIAVIVVTGLCKLLILKKGSS